MQAKIAKIISYLLHPLFMLTYGFLILFNLNTYISFIITPKGKLLILGELILITILLPLFTISVMKAKKLIETWQMKKREERLFPFIFTAIFYYLSFFLLKSLALPGIYYIFLLGSIMLLIIALIITFWWKISIHMIGIGGLLGAMIGMSYLLKIDIHLIITSIILLSGFLGFARLKNNSHSPIQVYSGFLLGAISMLFLFFISN